MKNLLSQQINVHTKLELHSPLFLIKRWAKKISLNNIFYLLTFNDTQEP